MFYFIQKRGSKLFKKTLFEGFTVLLLTSFFLFSCKKRALPLSEKKNIKKENIEKQVKNSTFSIDSLHNLHSQFKGTHDDVNLMLVCEALGNRYRIIANFSKAIQYHQQTLSLAQNIKDTFAITRAFNNIGTDFRRIGAYPEASDYHYQALKLTEEFSAKQHAVNRKNRVISLNGLGNIALSINNLTEAERNFRLALKNEIALKSHIGQAINYANIGAVFSQKQLLDSAHFYYQLSMEQNKLANSQMGIGLCHIYFGEIYERKKQLDRAEQEYLTAYKIMNKIDDPWHWLESCLAIAQINLQKKQYRKTIQNIIQARETAISINSPEHLSRIYNLLHQYYEDKKEYKQSLKNYKLSQTYKDSIFNIKKTNQVNELRMSFEREKNIRQIEQLHLEHTRQKKEKRIILTASIIGLLLLALFLAALFYAYYQRTKSHKVLKELEKIRTRFFTNISHEFRTPLTLIKAPIEEMLENNDCEKMNENLKIVLRNTNQMLFLVEQLLNISRLDVGKFVIQARKDSLSLTIQIIAASFEYFAAKKSIDYQQEIVSVEDVWYDANIVEIILINLLSNAMKFSPERANVRLTTTHNPPFYTIIVSNDTDKELTEDELTHLFDRFYTTANKSHTGSGIGLSLIKEICKFYRAKINFQYENKRITFIVNLPVQKSHFNENEIAPQTDRESIFLKPIKEKDDVDSSPQKEAPIILLVEDNDDMRYFLHKFFEKDYKVVAAKNGKEGIDKASEIIPDIIVSDIMMPDIDGLSLCDTLKTNYITSHIPIILLTALNEQADIIKGLEHKADDYISKPFNSKILLTKVKNQLRHRDTLIKKYKEEFGFQPLSINLKENEQSFVSLLKKVSEKLTNSNFGVEEFCETCAMSRTQLHRKLKATTGLSATAYIRFYRVNIASRMLKENPKLSIMDVCYASGFSDTSYFSKCFKEQFNVSPNDYRKKCTQ